MSNLSRHRQYMAHSKGITRINIVSLCSIRFMIAHHCSLTHNLMDWTDPVANDCGLCVLFVR